MNARRRRCLSTLTKLALTATLALGGSSGCCLAAQRVVKGAMGTSSEATEVPGTLTADLKSFGSATIEPVAIGSRQGLVPKEYTASLPGMLGKHLTQAEGAPLPGGGNTLTITPEVHWFHEAGTLEDIAGSDSYAVVMFTLTSEGQPVGRVQIVTHHAAPRIDHAAMAEATAEELAAWLEDKREPKEES